MLYRILALIYVCSNKIIYVVILFVIGFRNAIPTSHSTVLCETSISLYWAECRVGTNSCLQFRLILKNNKINDVIVGILFVIGQYTIEFFALYVYFFTQIQCVWLLIACLVHYILPFSYCKTVVYVLKSTVSYAN